MNLELLRFASGRDSTLGALSINGDFVCFTLEDERREVKVPGETRIPAGTYELALRTDGGMSPKYQVRFPDMHRGMLHVENVPGFEWIYFHVGNSDRHTAGCILVGDQAHQNVTERGLLAASVDAYRRLYVPVAAAIASRRTTLTVVDHS